MSNVNSDTMQSGYVHDRRLQDVSFHKFHYNDLLPTVRNFPVWEGKLRENVCNGFWALLQQVLDGCISCNTSCNFVIVIRSNNSDRSRSAMSISWSMRGRSRRRSGAATKKFA